MIKVLKSFYDLQDNCYKYKKGDAYPRKGYKPTDARIEELASDKNKIGVVLIEFEQPKEEIKPKKQTKKVKQ